MTTLRNWWTCLAIVALAAGLGWIAVDTPLTNRQKPREAAFPGLSGLKSHGSPLDRLIPEAQLLSRSRLTDGPGSNDTIRGEIGALDDDRDNRGGRDRDPGRDRDGNVFVNDPCLDPPGDAPFPFNFFDTVQSETEIAILNSAPGAVGPPEVSGRLMVAGYNDSRGFSDNRQGLSGFSYSTDGGKQWIDASGLPPLVPAGAPAGTLGQDAYFGDPVVAVHHRTKKFYYASLYQTPAGAFTISVNSGEFRDAPRQVPVESFANTRCARNPELHGVPDPPAFVRERIIWNPPVQAVIPSVGEDGLPGTGDDDFLDKEWLYVNQETGVLYVTYTRFGADGSTPLELVRSFDGGNTWTPPSVIVPNLLDTFNQATQAVVTPTGRVIVTWFARTFALEPPLFPEIEQRIETAHSDTCDTPAPCLFSAPVVVDEVNPQGEPFGYNRQRFTILNAPFIVVDKGRDDGVITHAERRQRGFGNVYVTYFDGRTTLPQPPPLDPGSCDPQELCNPFAREANILLSRSTNNGTSYRTPVKVNNDRGDTTHVFPSVQVNRFGEVFVTWIDRRVDRVRNLLNDTYGDVSTNAGVSFGADGRITTVSTDWLTREDITPDFGDYNSSEMIDFTHFVSIWADGRFPKPAPCCPRTAADAATPDSLFAIIKRSLSGGDDRHDR